MLVMCADFRVRHRTTEDDKFVDVSTNLAVLFLQIADLVGAHALGCPRRRCRELEDLPFEVG